MNETQLLFLLIVLIGELLAIAVLVGGRETAPPVIVVQPTPDNGADIGCMMLVLLPALLLLALVALLIFS